MVEHGHTDEMVATHTGWYFFCPVWMRIYTRYGCPEILERDVPEFVFHMADFLQGAINWMIAFFDPSSCGYVFWLVKELDKPLHVKIK